MYNFFLTVIPNQIIPAQRLYSEIDLPENHNPAGLIGY